MKLKIEFKNKTEYSAELKNHQMLINDNVTPFEIQKIDEEQYLLTRNYKVYNIHKISKTNNQLLLRINGQMISCQVKDRIAQALEILGIETQKENSVSEITAPMPGTILEIFASDGDEIEEGQSILVLEAMKMENIIKSPGKGKISKLHIRTGQNVEKNQVLVSF